MDYLRFAITNPVKVAVAVLLLVLFGFVALNRIPVQLTPNVDQPIITVTTSWTGRSPEEVEREVIEPQEDVLKDISDLQKMTATAFDGRAEIQLEFSVGADVDAARQEVSDSLREVPEYPDEVDEPVIAAGETAAESPIAWLLLSSDDPDFDVQSLGDVVEDRIKPYLERAAGVSEVRVYGGREREIHLRFHPNRLAQYGVTFNELRRSLQLDNVNISAGTLREGKRDWRVRTVGQYEDDLDQIRETVIMDTAGGPIRVRDLATVERAFSKRRSFVRSKGQVSLALPVYRESGSNVMRTMADVKQRVAHVQEVLLPSIAGQVQRERGLAAMPPLTIRQVYDETIYITDALSLVVNNLFIGGALAILALLLFLRKIRPTVVVAVSIPISIIGVFVVLAGFGRNVNVISLAGMAFAVGMVVDNAIVVLENIDRHISMGERPARAAYLATKEVWGAIIASTLTTLAVFIPVLTIQEEAGQLFRDIALAICAAVTLSLIVSVTVIPTAAGRFLVASNERGGTLGKAGRNLFGLVPVASWVGTKFASLIHWLTAPRPATVLARVAIVAFFTLASIVGAALLMPPADYLPSGNRNLVFGVMLTPPGYNIEHDEFIAERVESVVRPYWEAETVEDLQTLPPVIHPFTQQPVQNLRPIENYFIVSFFGGMFTGAISADKNVVAPTGGLLTSAMNTIPGTIGFARQSSLFGRGIGGTRSVDVEVTGLELDKVLRSAETMLGELRRRYGYPNVQPEPRNFDLPGPEVQVRVNQVVASELGIDTSALGLGVQAMIDGLRVGDFRAGADSLDILAVLDPDYPLSPESLEQTPLAAIGGADELTAAQIGDVARVVTADAPQQIRRIEEMRAVTLSVTPPDDVALEAATAAIAAIEDNLRETGGIDPDVEVQYGGSASKLAEVRESLLGEWKGWNLDSLMSLGGSRIFLALLVTYLLMAALFESWLYPFVIMFSVPLATVGGFLGLSLVSLADPMQKLDVLTMLGFVILIGIVVNNAILIVHQALNFMRGLGESNDEKLNEPLAPREAIRESVRTRLRPVLMTTLTSVSGMLPLVLMPGAGSELYRGLGSVVVGGLIIASLFTLIVVPLLFSLVLDAKVALTGRAEEPKANIDADDPVSPTPSTA